MIFVQNSYKWAAGLFFIFSLNSAQSATYPPSAANAVKDAFLIQSGLNTALNDLGRYSYGVLDRKGLKEPVSLLASAWSVYRRQEVSFKLMESERLILRPNAVQFEIHF